MVTIKNIPTIVGSDADHVDLKDEVIPATVSAHETSITTGHEVTTDDSSTKN